MTAFLIEIKNAPVTVNLSPFVGLNKNSINWGDNNTTIDTYTHTYQNDGFYEITGNFEEVTKINDNFTIENLNTIDISGFSSLFEIGNNFLQNCTNLKYLNLYDLSVLDNIGTGFLNGCTNLECIKLSTSVTNLNGWGENIGISKTIIFYTDKKYYTDYSKSNWCGTDSPTHQLISLDFEYMNGIDEDYVQNVSFGQTPLVNYNNVIKLDLYPTLKAAFDNQNLFAEDNLPELVDENTRMVYKDEELLKKTYFIYQYTYYFRDNPTFLGYNETNYTYTRLLKAKRLFTVDDEHFLEVEMFDKDITYYNPENEDPNTMIVDKKYLIAEMLKDIDDSHVYRYDTEVIPYQFYDNPELDYNDPPYFRSAIIFGLVTERNSTNLLYSGEVETGINIEIKVKGICKNLYIYDLDINEELGRREYIKINTDRLPLGKLVAGDYILIKTKQGEKSAKLERDGETIDIMKYIDRTSSWLTVKQGDNYFYASADSGPDDGSIYNVQISLYSNTLYEGA